MTDALVNLGDLTKPATVLIEKISDAIGGIFKPHQIVRVAKAEAEADQIRAESQIQVTDIHRRALHRFLEEEAKKQANIEEITRKAIPLLEKESAPQNIDNDWIINFFDKCRIVSDDDMQELWSKVLAVEANMPGKFSRRTVNLLADLNKFDAELFVLLCNFVWMLGDNIAPLVFNVQDPIYKQHGLKFNLLAHLESLGFVKLDTTGFNRVDMPKNLTIDYYGAGAELIFPKIADNSLGVGTVLFSRAGYELAQICDSTSVDGFFDYVCNIWLKQGLVINKNPTSQAPADA